MAISISADYLNEVLPGSKQAPDTKMFAVDETFQKIFSSIQETKLQINDRVDTRKANDKNVPEREKNTSTISHDATNQAPRKDVKNRNDIKEPGRDKNENQKKVADDKRPKPNESAQSGDKVVLQEKPVNDKTDDKELTEEEIKKKILKLLKKLLAGSGKKKEMDDNLASLEKAASLIAKRLFALSESDPSAFKKLMEDFSKISLKDKGKNPGQAIAQIIKLIQTTGAQNQTAQSQPEQNQTAQNQDIKNIEALLNKALKQIEKTDPAPEDKKTALKDISAKGEKRADGQPFDKPISAGKDDRANAKAANNKDTAAQPGAPKQAVSDEAVNPVKDQVKADVKPNSIKITNNTTVHTNLAPDNSGKTARADRPHGGAKFTSREVFERMMVDQIVRKARVNIRANGASNVVIQIDPPNLGKVNIRISVHDNIVKAYLIADNREVRSILENNLDNLKNSMNNQGLKIDQINVTTPEAFAQSRNETQGNDSGSESNQYNQRHTSRAEQAAGNEGEMTTAQVRALAHDGVLNVVA